MLRNSVYIAESKERERESIPAYEAKEPAGFLIGHRYRISGRNGRTKKTFILGYTVEIVCPVAQEVTRIFRKDRRVVREKKKEKKLPSRGFKSGCGTRPSLASISYPIVSIPFLPTGQRISSIYNAIGKGVELPEFKRRDHVLGRLQCVQQSKPHSSVPWVVQS